MITLLQIGRCSIWNVTIVSKSGGRLLFGAVQSEWRFVGRFSWHFVVLLTAAYYATVVGAECVAMFGRDR